MRVFDHPNMTDFCCPICDSREDKPVILLPIPGTQNGNISQAKQVHFDCFRVWMGYFADTFAE